jgi:hypothetical protein
LLISVDEAHELCGTRSVSSYLDIFVLIMVQKCSNRWLSMVRALSKAIVRFRGDKLRRHYLNTVKGILRLNSHQLPSDHFALVLESIKVSDCDKLKLTCNFSSSLLDLDFVGC